MDGNRVGTITKTLAKGAGAALGGLAAAGIAGAMGAPASAGALFGVKGARFGRNLGSNIFRKMNPSSKPMKVKKPKAKEIKTAKPKAIKPNPIKVNAEERKQILGGLYGVGGFKPGSSLTKSKGLDRPLGFKDVASGFKTNTGKTLITKTANKMEKKKQPLTVFDKAKANKALLDDLEKDKALKLFR